jgi:hypothetical protein
MVGLVAFLIALGMAGIAVVADFKLGVPLVWPMVLLTATWAAWDSTRIRIREYQTGVALSPVSLWLGMALLWIVVFPWYLAARYRFQKGTLPRKALPLAPASRPPA